jgi:hypothetical protein
MTPTVTSNGRIALHFAQLLSTGQWAQAHAMLMPQLQLSMSAVELQNCFESMIQYWPAKSVTSIEVTETLEAWPARLPGDVGWVYVAINGEGDSEAVSAVVTQIEDVPLIRELEWGRP